MAFFAPLEVLFHKEFRLLSLAIVTIVFSDELVQLNKLEGVNDTGFPTAVFNTRWHFFYMNKWH